MDITGRRTNRPPTPPTETIAPVTHLDDFRARRQRRTGGDGDERGATEITGAALTSPRAATRSEAREPRLLTLKEGLLLPDIAGAAEGDVARVVESALAFTAWRRASTVGPGDAARHAAAWTLRRLEPTGDLGSHRNAQHPADWSDAERAAVRWALTRFLFLLTCGLRPVTARDETVTIPLEASGAQPPVMSERGPRHAPGHRSDRDNAVPGTAPVWAHSAAQYRAQRLVARRILNVGRNGHWHDGWLTVPADLASVYGWEVVAEA